MHSYELRWSAEKSHKVKSFRFQADDPSQALSIAHGRNEARLFELWEDGRKVCNLTRDPVGSEEVWVVGGAHSTKSPEEDQSV